MPIKTFSLSSPNSHLLLSNQFEVKKSKNNNKSDTLSSASSILNGKFNFNMTYIIFEN